jgi:hypothetical protein
MKFSIIHLSDIHLKEKEKDNPVLHRSENIIDAVKNNLLNTSVVFLVVSGDIAFSGKKEEYSFAENFLSAIKTGIERYNNINCEIIVIAGNHDCNFTSDSIRDAVIKSLEYDGYRSLDDKQIDICCSPQDNYFAFESNISSKNLKRMYFHKLLKIFEYQQDETSIVFNCFNTSWISKYNEEAGKMVFPAEFFEDTIFNNASNLTFNLIHHPINWQSPIASREFKKTLHKVGDIILSGHEHESDAHVNIDNDGKFTGYIESGELQDTHDRNHSDFSQIIFDTENGSYKIQRYSLKGDLYKMENESSDIKYQQRFKRGTNTLFLNPSFYDELDSVGAQFIHSQVENIYLSDIFVYPKIKKLSPELTKKKSLDTIINSEELFYPPSTDRSIRNIIIGADFSGKSTICKRLFSYYYENGMIPILIKGSEVKEVNKERFRKDLKSIFLKQYDKRYTDIFDQIDNSHFVLIVDDFQGCNIKNLFRLRLIENIKEVYQNIIFIGNSTIQFESLIYKDGQREDAFSGFDKYTLLEMGIEGRNRLISNWIRLGRESFIEKNEILKQIDYAEKQIQMILGKGFIPSYPIFIITLLQTIENGITNPEYSLYGHYYEYLINDSIIKNITDKSYHQFYHQFLTEYCNFLFDNKFKEISKDDFRRYYEGYKKDYTVTMSFEVVFLNLQKAKFIHEREGYISISYKYIYYYYIARYYANNISDGTIRLNISKMCNRLYREEFANILMFLTHLSKDPLILSEIYNTTENLLKDVPIAKIEKDVERINSLIDEVPSLVLQSESIDELRKADLQDREDYERIEKDFELQKLQDNYDLDEDISNIDTLRLFIMSIKSFELLGQITKKYWGSIKGDQKLQYAESTCNLALRTLNFYFICIYENREGLISWVKLLVDRKKITDSLKIQEFTKRFIFQLSFISCFGIIKRVSAALGHVELTDTYKGLLDKNPYNAFKLIDLSIKLDFFPSFPFKDIDMLWDDKEISKNYLAKVIIQNMVYGYIQLYDLNISERQRICAKLNIKIKDQLAAYDESAIKKD